MTTWVLIAMFATGQSSIMYTDYDDQAQCKHAAVLSELQVNKGRPDPYVTFHCVGIWVLDVTQHRKDPRFFGYNDDNVRI